MSHGAMVRRQTSELLGRRVGHIRIVDVLGEGGMGAVYAGFDDTLQRKVAVKAIRSEFRLDPGAKARFLREARILSQLNHPEICTVHEFVEGEDSDFLVMELVEGVSLREAMRHGLDRPRQLELAAHLLDVLVAVHGRGVAHRDLKPENVMITPGGAIKVLDFGLARSVAEQPTALGGATHVLDERMELASTPPDADATMDGRTMALGQSPPPSRASGSGSDGEIHTMAGTVIGTAGYMSPEQARGEPSTSASDMYSLGLILQELFTGQAAFDRGLDRHALLARTRRGETRPVEGLPPELTRLVERLKAVEPGARPSALDAAERLAWFRDAPRRRRTRALKLGAWVVLAAFALVMAVQAYRLAQARRREELASRFGAEVQRIESLMRFAHMAPLHDLGEDADRVRQRITWIREHMGDVGDWGVAHGLYAIGRGHLALGELGEARSTLEDAWQRGYQEPEAAYALGLALGGLYQRGLDGLRAIFDPEARRVERERLERELRDPAVRFLRLSAGADTVEPSYAEGLLALYERRPEDALRLAERCSGSLSWFYECHLLEGNAWYQIGRQQRESGQGSEALTSFEHADAAYSEAKRVAASDPRGAGGVCRVWADVLEMRLYDLGGELQPVVDRALEGCNAALAADPRQPEVLATKAACYRMLAESRLRREQDADEALEGARATAEQLVAVAPESPHAHHLAGVISMFSAAADMMQGRDGVAKARAAVASLERCVELDPSDAGAHLDLGNAHHWCGKLLAEAGDDPTAELEAAAASFRKAAELKPTYAEAHNNLASLDVEWAEILLGRGDDPRAKLEEALAACDRALKLKPDHAYAVANRGIAHLRLGQLAARQGGDPVPELSAAREWLSRAVEHNPDNPATWLSLAEAVRDEARARHERGEPVGELVAEGRRATDRALAIVPGWEPAAAIRRELDLLVR